jgi:predicted TIM-barrel fold metal-dependent hydrolase
VTSATTATGSKEASAKPPTDFAFIDCDIHPHFRNGLNDLAPYMDEAWRQKLGISDLSDAKGGWEDLVPAARYGLPRNEYWKPPGGVMRRDAAPPGGGAPASDPAFVAEQLLDPFAVVRGLLIGGNMLSLGALPNADIAIVLASAYNDWMRERWLEVDDRYLGAALVAVQDPLAAAEEIERVKSWPGIAAVLMSPNRMLMGDRYYHPIYEAAEAAGLPIVAHPQGVEGIFSTAPTLAGGVPSYYLELKQTTGHHVAEMNSNSLVVQGVFERFPKLKVAFVESGFLWLLENMWRLDHNWRALREETPWLKRLPSEYIFDHIRVTTQPFPEAGRKDMLALLEMMQAERLLMAASDYPHWDFDDPLKTLRTLPAALRQAICIDNPTDFFGPRLRL